MFDKYGRHIHYLRISLTDACNLRCVYCMPEDVTFKPRSELLEDEEILRLVRIFAHLGVDKIRLTGGEPTIRPRLVELVRQIKRVSGIRELAMTTNGILLPELAHPLKMAGLDRVNISLDTLDPHKFHAITRWGHLEDVWAGINAAEAAGLEPIKINSVVTRGFNEEDVVDLARLTLDHPWDVRFIELMPVGGIAEFAQSAVVPSRETRERIEKALGPLQEVAGHDPRDPARPYRLPGAQGRIGFIDSISNPFCAGCTRIRLTADGKLRLCLLHDTEVDLLTPLREGADDETLARIIREAVWEKPWGHGLARNVIPRSRHMSQIGG
ncbi:MAG: GTP 3',8-cyclase MoaA [Chloroflexi bacterium]|nr:GTP 3',8-cyclase MoaA [Chloroflexota bacterium]